MRCKDTCHFAILSKEDFNRALGQIERRKHNERIQFLQSLPYFDKITKNSVSKISLQLEDVTSLKGQTLYKEGDQADYVYLVKEGQYESTRIMTFNEDLGERTKKIFTNPLRAQKITGTSKMSSLKH
jgi:hypothetical protein